MVKFQRLGALQANLKNGNLLQAILGVEVLQPIFTVKYLLTTSSMLLAIVQKTCS